MKQSYLKKLFCLLFVVFLLYQGSLTKAQPLDSENYRQLGLAKILIQDGKIYDAEKALRAVLKNNPNNSQAFLQLINLYINTNQLLKAKRTLKNAVIHDPNNSKLLSYSALLSYKTSQPDKAEILAQKALKFNSRNSIAYLVLGKVYFDRAMEISNLIQKEKVLKESFRNFYISTELDPTLPDGFVGMARVYQEQGITPKAYDEFLKAKELDTCNPETLYFLGEFFYNNSQYDNAIKYVKKSISYNSRQDYKAHYLLADVYESVGDLDNAYKEYTIVLKLKPDFSEAKQRLEDIKKNFKPQIEVNHEERQVDTTDKMDNLIILEQINQDINLLLQADLYAICDKYTQARDLYNKILQNNSENISALAGLTELYYSKWMQGNFDSKNFILDSEYLSGIESSKLKITSLKMRLITGELSPEATRQELQDLMNYGSNDYIDLINASRAAFMLGEFQKSKEYLDKALKFDVSDHEKFKIAKYLYFDHNYYEAKSLLSSIRNTEYTDSIKIISNKIEEKIKTAADLWEDGLQLYKKKRYPNSLNKYELAIKCAPTFKTSHLYYAYLLKKFGHLEMAIAELKVYSELDKMYPSSNPEITRKNLEKLITTWQKRSLKTKK